MTTVFISYSHDDDAHKQRVLDLAGRLRGDGLTVAIDRDHPGGPDEGWPLWCDRQVSDSDRVLVVCTETYRRRFELDEDPGEGYGAIWEAQALRQLLYQDGGLNRRVRAVLLNDQDAAHIPTRLASHSHFFTSRPDSYADLAARDGRG